MCDLLAMGLWDTFCTSLLVSSSVKQRRKQSLPDPVAVEVNSADACVMLSTVSGTHSKDEAAPIGVVCPLSIPCLPQASSLSLVLHMTLATWGIEPGPPGSVSSLETLCGIALALRDIETAQFLHAGTGSRSWRVHFILVACSCPCPPIPRSPLWLSPPWLSSPLASQPCGPRPPQSPLWPE